MTSALAAEEVRRWLEGQRRAQQVIMREKRDWLSRLDPREALLIYEALREAATVTTPEGLSPVLIAMRRLLAKAEEF